MRSPLNAGMMILAFFLAGGAGWSTEERRIQAASGTVTAVAEGSRTIVVESQLDGKSWVIGAEATDQTKFEGKAKTLADVKPGDRVTIRWVREENRLVVQSVTVR